MARVTILPVRSDTIPAALRSERRWVVWNLETRGAKLTKVPYQAQQPTQRADVSDPRTWADFQTALATYEDGKADGIGFVLGDGFVGLDVDDCRDAATGAIDPGALELITLINTYVEVSPRGSGVKAIARGRKPGKRCRSGRFELYDTARFFCITGHCVPNFQPTIEDRTAEVAAIYAYLFPPKSNGNGHRGPIDHDDAALITKALAARNGATFSALWDGDARRYGYDDSAADLAFCALLAFWTAADSARMDRLFRQSGLFRAKWDSPRGASTYGQMTIDKAIAGCHEVYRDRHGDERHQEEQRSNGARRARKTSQPQPLVAADRLTEAGAAERFARSNGHCVRFDHRRQRWLMWQGHRWVPDADAAVIRLALDFVRTWQREAVEIADRSQREDVLKFTIRLERRDTLNCVLALAKALKPIADAGDLWDTDAYLLAVNNGVIDLRTGGLRTGRPEDQITMRTAVPFDADALCPRWERFIAEVFAGNVELMAFVQRAIGYSLTGITNEQVLFLLHGTGSNGKSTLINTLKRVLGDYAFNMPFTTIELKNRSAIPNDLAALNNRRFVIASETNDGTRLNEARVKALTGCDPVTARFLHGEFFTFEPVGKFWLSVNHKPIVRDDSYGFWRRLRLIPFTQRFDVNPILADELLAEGPGILAWCVQGTLAWQRDGLQAPAIVLNATAEYQHESDPLADFLSECCEVDPDAEVRAAEFYASYGRWADRGHLRREDRLTLTAFGRKATERFQKDSDRRGTVYRGVRVVSLVL
jgi:putative DNA primase/helicase